MCVDVDSVGSKARALVRNKRERRLRVAVYMEYFRVVCVVIVDGRKLENC